MADSSNSSATSSTSSQSTGSQSTGSQTSSTSATTSNSTGNFSGGLPGLGGQSWGSYSSSPSSETGAAHASGVQGPGLANGNFGSSWSGNGNSGSGSGDYTYNNTSYSNNKSEPVMTVDEVYGNTETSTGISGNQSVVESQGDYAASSNEKSGVETSTFGKQDNITVTPESVTENKGLVDNAAIDSIEGLNFQQKDKANQEVMEAKKSRDDAEAEDNADGMRNQLKAVAEKDAEETETDAFKVGESEAEKSYNDEDAAWQQNLQEQKAQIDAYKQSIEDDKAEVAHYEASVEKGRDGMKDFLESAKVQLAQDTKTLETLQSSYDEMEQQYNSWKDDSKSKVENGEMVEALAAKAKEKANKAFEIAQKEMEYEVAKDWNDRSKESIQRSVNDAIETLKTAEPGSDEYNQAIAELQGINQDHIGLFKGDPFAYKDPGKMIETITNAYDSQTARFQKAYDAIANSKESGNKEAIGTINSAIKQIENFELKADEVRNLDNWLEGSGSNTATNEKFNQSLSYDEWLKLIEADPTMRDYAKKLIAEKKEK